MENRVWEKIDAEVSKIKQGMPSSTKIVEVLMKNCDNYIDCVESDR